MFIDGRLREKTLIYLLLIVLLAILLRVPYLQTIPMGFNCDEAVTGYEAYSISETLRDRYGDLLPLFARAMGDYRPSLYIFISIPFVKLFGLNEFATRFPAAVSGILTVLATYFLAQRLFNKNVALFASLLLAISPWYIHFNRIAYEVNLLPLFFCFGFWLFLEGFKKPNCLILSAMMFGLSLNTYQAARVFVPLFMLGIILIFNKHLFRHKKQVFLASLVFILIFIPLFKVWISPAGMSRASQVGIDLNATQVLRNYLSFFDPRYLFFNGSDDIQVNPTGLGCLYPFEVITVFCGLFYLIFKGGKEQKSLLLWLALYPIPAALVDVASPTRSLVGAPLFAIVSGLGFVQLLDFLKSRFIKKSFLQVAVASVLIASLLNFCQHYYLSYPAEAAILWKFGMRDAINYAEKNEYESIVMSSDRDSGCYALHDFIAHVPFYIQYPPEEYQKSPISPYIRNSRDKVYVLGKYKLMSIVRQPNLDDKSIYIIRPDEIQEIARKGYLWKEVTTTKDSRGVEYFKLVEINKKSN